MRQRHSFKASFQYEQGTKYKIHCRTGRIRTSNQKLMEMTEGGDSCEHWSWKSTPHEIPKGRDRGRSLLYLLCRLRNYLSLQEWWCGRINVNRFQYPQIPLFLKRSINEDGRFRGDRVQVSRWSGEASGVAKSVTTGHKKTQGGKKWNQDTH